MPLFNNWPYVDLSKLNLDWIMMKIKHVEEAEADAARVIEAAEQILPLVDQVDADADRAEAAAAAAEHSAEEADNSQELALTYAGQAQGSATRAAASEQNAAAAETNSYNNMQQTTQYLSDANAAAVTAGNASLAAAGSATSAEQAAVRAENAASTTGFTGRSGSITANAYADISVLHGEYILIYKADDDQSSAGILYLNVSSSGTLPIRKLVTYVGSSGVTLFMNTANVLRIMSTFNATVHWTLLGFNYGS